MFENIFIYINNILYNTYNLLYHIYHILHHKMAVKLILNHVYCRIN